MSTSFSSIMLVLAMEVSCVCIPVDYSSSVQYIYKPGTNSLVLKLTVARNHFPIELFLCSETMDLK